MYFSQLVVMEGIADVLLVDVEREVGEFDSFLGHNYKVSNYEWRG